MKIAVVDYGLGNLRSVAGAIERLGHKAIVTRDAQELSGADKLILPGVGAFGDGMANLNRLDLVRILTDLVLGEKKPILGICLGAQLMAESSEEFGHHEGLAWIKAKVQRFDLADKSLLVPHVGWNELRQEKESALFHEIPSDALFYYVHSFWISSSSRDHVVGTCEYGNEFTAVFCQQNICGTQFHPEKSQRHGIKMVENFIERF